MSERMAYPRMTRLAALAATLAAGSTLVLARSQAVNAKGKILAQKAIEQALSNHPEITGIELAAQTSTGCETIASNDPKDLGDKCDEDELEPMRTGKPFVEHESDGFDATLALHDAKGRIIATVGMDFKPEPDQKESTVVEQAKKIAHELEAQLTSKAKLFEPAEQ